MGVSSAFFVFEGRLKKAGRAAANERAGRPESEGVDAIYRDIPEALRNLIEPVVDEHDCELVDVEMTQNSGQRKSRGLLRITVDSRLGDGRVPIERCVSISREVETLLDAADSMPGAYQLEVSSPGLDRVLGREKDFIAAVDREVKLRTSRPIEGRKRFRGRLLAVETANEPGRSSVLRLNVDGKEARIPLDDVEKANSIYEFTRADFAKAPPKVPSRKHGNDTNGNDAKKSDASGSSQTG